MRDSIGEVLFHVRMFLFHSFAVRSRASFYLMDASKACGFTPAGC